MQMTFVPLALASRIFGQRCGLLVSVFVPQSRIKSLFGTSSVSAPMFAPGREGPDLEIRSLESFETNIEDSLIKGLCPLEVLHVDLEPADGVVFHVDTPELSSVLVSLPLPIRIQQHWQARRAEFAAGLRRPRRQFSLRCRCGHARRRRNGSKRRLLRTSIGCKAASAARGVAGESPTAASVRRIAELANFTILAAGNDSRWRSL
jgi:hypothetical protein